MQTHGEAIGDAPPTVLDVFPSMRSPPEAVRASLEAVRAAQLAARARARREMWQARAVVGGVAAAVTIAGLLLWPHFHAAKAARAASAVTVVAPTGPAKDSQPAAATAPVPGGLLAAGVADLPTSKEAPSAASDAAALDACRDNYQGKRWRAAAAACATAFTAHSDDAKLALRVAEAEYARDHLTEAREWAQRTVALDPKQADALAILGRSEQRTGHPDAAARAFRRYLALAPRGWHASEARAVLRGPRQTAPVAARAGQPREPDQSATRPTGAPEQAATAPSLFAPLPPLAPVAAPTP